MVLLDSVEVDHIMVVLKCVLKMFGEKYALIFGTMKMLVLFVVNLVTLNMVNITVMLSLLFKYLFQVPLQHQVITLITIGLLVLLI